MTSVDHAAQTHDGYPEDAGARASHRPLSDVDRSKVHPFVRATAEWTWRVVLILFGCYLLMRIFLEFEQVLVPVALAILVSAFLVPGVDWLDRRRVPLSLIHI